MKKKVGIFAFSMTSLCFLMMGCPNSPNEPSAPTADFQLDYPTANVELHLGDTVDIIFKANADKHSSVGLRVAQENGIFYDILSSSVSIKPNVNTYKIKWIIGSECEYSSETPLYSDTSSTDCKWRCRIQLYDYQGSEKINSEYFTVKLVDAFCLRYPCAASRNTFDKTQEMSVIYTVRSDLFSSMLYSYWSTTGDKWYQINYNVGKISANQTSNEYDIRTYKKKFLPSDPKPITEIDPTKQIVGDSTKIRIQGYSSNPNSPPFIKESGWIKWR